MFPTPYVELNAVLRALVEGMQAALGDDFVSACLQGSFAVGDFDGDSDVDFIVATARELSDEQVDALQIMHRRIFALECPWAQHLEGSYFPQDLLRDYTRAGTPVWYLDHGSREIIPSAHCNTVVVRWVVRTRGVPLAGRDPATLVDPIPVDALRREIWQAMIAGGEAVRANPAQYDNRFYQGYLVLNYCRMAHDLLCGLPGSKRAGAEWAKANLDPAWADLIDRAWDGRPDPAFSVRQRADPVDLARTLEFIRYVTDVGRAYAARLLPGGG